jgi:HEAT repeat protein
VTEQLLVVVLIVEAGVVVFGLGWLAGRIVVVSARQRRDAEALRRARELVRGAVLGGSSAGAAVRAFRELSLSNGIAVLTELSHSMSGACLVRLRYVAVAGGMAARAHRWSRSRRWWLRLRGLRLLAQLGIVPTPPHRFFDDPHPAVKAAAADCAVAPVPPEVVARMLAMLDDPDAGCRFSAKVGLFRIGRDATDSVLAYLTADARPALAAALEVAVALGDPAFAESALRLSAAPDSTVRRAAAALLARTGGGDIAGPRLLDLLGDPDAGVRVAAADGVGELGHWPAAPLLAAGLRDPVWTVRLSAAVALRRIGPAGAVYLRRAAGSGDSIAAAIAQQVLALPEGAMSVVGR